MSEIELYNTFIKADVYVRHNFPDDIEWSERASTRQDWGRERFIQEYVFAVYVSGFRYQVVQKNMEAFREIFYDWDLDKIHDNKESVKSRALKIINNERKINAILNGLDAIYGSPFDKIKEDLLNDINYFKIFPYIGDTMKYQLARNLGFDVIKPDKHINRIAKYFNMDPFEMCKKISKKFNIRVHTVDTILWRYAEQGNLNYVR